MLPGSLPLSADGGNSWLTLISSLFEPRDEKIILDAFNYGNHFNPFFGLATLKTFSTPSPISGGLVHMKGHK